MAVEIERRFLVLGRPWEAAGAGRKIDQGYLHTSAGKTVRARILGERGFLCVKVGRGVRRDEFEYEIPLQDARALLELGVEGQRIEKTRYTQRIGPQLWEIDVFEGSNRGLVMAEAELPAEDAPLELPPWIGTEVTHDARYLNAELARNPYSSWSRT